MNALHIEFDLPSLLATQAGFNSENATAEVRRMLALFLYEHQRLSLGKALEMAEISYWVQWISQASRVLKPAGSLYVCGFSEILADLKHPNTSKP